MGNPIIKIRSLVIEEINLISGTVTEIRKTLKTSIADIANQIEIKADESKRLAQAIRFRVSNGATVTEALEAINNKENK